MKHLRPLAAASVALGLALLPQLARAACASPDDNGGLCNPNLWGGSPAQTQSPPGGSGGSGGLDDPNLWGGGASHNIPGTNIPDQSVPEGQAGPQPALDSGDTGMTANTPSLPDGSAIDPGMEVDPMKTIVPEAMKDKKDKDNASKQAFNNDDIHKNDDAAAAENVGNAALGSAGASDVASAGDAVGAGVGGAGPSAAGGGGGGGTSSATSGGTLNAATAGQVTAQVDPNHPSGTATGAGGAGASAGALPGGGKTQEQLQRDAAYVARVARQAQLRRAQFNLQSAMQNLARQQQHMSNIGKFSSQAAGDQQKQAQLGQAIGEQQQAGNSMMMQALYHALSAASQIAAARRDGNTAQTAVHNAAALSARTTNSAPVFATFSGPPATHGGSGSSAEKTLAAGSSLNFGGNGGNGGSGNGATGSSSELGSGTGSTVTKAAATAGTTTSQEDPSRKPAAATAPKIYFGVYTPAPIEQVVAPSAVDSDYVGPLARFLPADQGPGTRGDDADILKATDHAQAKRKTSAFQDVAGQ